MYIILAARLARLKEPCCNVILWYGRMAFFVVGTLSDYLTLSASVKVHTWALHAFCTVSMSIYSCTK